MLDFFAGSGTTAHAVMEQNIIDGGNRQFILVQLPESINEKRNKTAYDFAKNELKSKNPTIFDITKERILRAKNHLIAKYAEKDLSDFDLDFKIYELEERKFDIEEQARLAQGDLGLYDYDVNTIATTWKLYDGISLQTPLKAIELGDYIAHYDNDKKLYLINTNFTNENLKNLIERLDEDRSFTPNMIVIYGRNFDSAKQCEVCHNLENLINKKSIDLKIIVRYF